MEIVNRSVMFATLLLVQVLILNHVHLLGVAIPLVYVLFVITLRRNTPWAVVLCSSFALGFFVDVFSSTPGLAAGSMTLIAFLQPRLLELFAPRDSADNMEASARTMGWGRFAVFTSVLTLIYCIVFFGLEIFNFFDWLMWLECSLASALLTWILILAIETVRSK